jgi:PGM1 C-terminal domain
VDIARTYAFRVAVKWAGGTIFRRPSGRFVTPAGRCCRPRGRRREIIAEVETVPFEELQARLRDLAPKLTVRTIEPEERTIVVVHSISFEVPAFVTPLLPAYEERFLCLVLILLRQPRTRVVYVTSQPVLPRLVDYWMELVPRLDRAEASRRLAIVSLVDGSPRPLTEKMLEHPRFLDRIRRLIISPERSVVIPFNVSVLERELAVRLGIPVYGPNPELAQFGTKSGSRRLFAEEGVPHPVGVEDVSGLRDVVTAIQFIRSRRPSCSQVIVKLNDAVSGFGNGLLTIGAGGEASARAISLEDPRLSADEFYELVAARGAIVEERIVGHDFRSPSAQLRVLPGGEVEVLSTHDQILGGPHAQTFLGSRLPADPEYAPAIASEAGKVAKRLAREGVIGRFAIDFVTVRGRDAWNSYAVEINLRNGGTSHPLFTLQALTDGVYEPASGIFSSSLGTPKHYVATDDLEDPSYRRLTPDDLLDLAAEQNLGWDDERQTGIAFHMVSALAVAGRVGLTAIGDSNSEADELYARARGALDDAAR